MTTIKWETANYMMNIVAFVAMRAHTEQGEQIDIEAIEEFARNIFQEYCDMVGITEVEEPEEENSEDFDEDYFEDSEEDFDEDYFDSEDNKEDDDDNVVYSLTVKGKFVLRCVEAGHIFEEACEIADLLFGEGE